MPFNAGRKWLTIAPFKSKSTSSSTPDNFPANSLSAADAPCELWTNANPESGAAAEAVKLDWAMAWAGFLRKILKERRFMMEIDGSCCR